MPSVQNPLDISVGPLHVKFFNETLGGCFFTGCLENARFAASRSMRPIICNGLESPVDYRPGEQGASLSLSGKELSAHMIAHGAGDGASIVSGSSIDIVVGTPGSASTVAAPCEWHIVKLTGAAPWTFTVYTENRDLWAASGTFVLDTDISVYFAALTNGDASVSVSAAVTVASTPGTSTITITDACLGKITFAAIADATIAQWTYDSTAAKFTINGTYPIIDSDVTHGDTVALIGIAYQWGKVSDVTGTLVDKTKRFKIQVARTLGEPIGIKAVHFFEGARNRRALIIRIWKARNMTGFGLGFDAMASRDITLDTQFMGLNDERNHPESPVFEIEKIESTTDLSLDTLL